MDLTNTMIKTQRTIKEVIAKERQGPLKGMKDWIKHYNTNEILYQ